MGGSLAVGNPWGATHLAENNLAVFRPKGAGTAISSPLGTSGHEADL